MRCRLGRSVCSLVSFNVAQTLTQEKLGLSACAAPPLPEEYLRAVPMVDNIWFELARTEGTSAKSSETSGRLRTCVRVVQTLHGSSITQSIHAAIFVLAAVDICVLMRQHQEKKTAT